MEIDIESVSTELIEDNIVSVSRQMIDKEASVPSATLAALNLNGASNGHANGIQGGGQVMEIDEEI